MNNKAFKSICILMLVLHFVASAQVQNSPPMRQVFCSTGGTGYFSLGTIDYTVGETIVSTDSAMSSSASVQWLTQGFQQPTNSSLSDKSTFTNSPCTGANKGSANLSVINNNGNATYSWEGSSFGSQQVFENLAPGTYQYKIKDGNFSLAGAIVISEDATDCAKQLKPYTGITPNGDSNNDMWVIDGISNFETNTVYIYNRWGAKIWETIEYNNESNAWNGKNSQGNELPDGTYFYLIEAISKDLKKTPRKGWIELTH